MIYLHVPFCRGFCTYCAFYSEVLPCGSGQRRVRGYVETVLREIRERTGEIRRTRLLSPDTLYIGGGTPSVLPLSVLETLLQACREATGDPAHRFGECTLEANPDDVVRGGLPYLQGLRDAGVNRLSVGIQSFDDAVLRWMNRRHDAAAARQAVRLIRDAGFDNLSIDLIFGIGGMTDRSWKETLDEALALHPQHLSAYQLSVEPDSFLEERLAAGQWKEASEAQCRRQYGQLCTALRQAGYRHYEVSNFALPGYEAVHNSAYWRRVPYVGLGPGAHSLSPDGRGRRWNSQDVEDYTPGSENLSDEDIRLETLMLALRTADGLDEEALRSLAASGRIDALLAGKSLARQKNRRIRIPENRFFVSDEIVRELA